MTEQQKSVGRPRRAVDDQGRLLCCLCDTRKDPQEFHAKTNSSSGRDSRCKECDRERRKATWQKKQRANRIARALRASAANLM
ncbi:hypothetical protein [Microbulbifer sp. PSTR4-B]|uniref:hypothetical protein n=1 Tax=Microbulbifer sp. PSTR4-B TaxID=3243396 RepID=UPI00403A00BA